MSAETTTYTALSTHSGLIALVSTRIYPQYALPQNCPLPHVTYLLIDSVPQEKNLDGDYNLIECRIQVDSWSSQYDHSMASQVAAQVMLAMATINRCEPVNHDPAPSRDPNTLEHRRTQDFKIFTEKGNL